MAIHFVCSHCRSNENAPEQSAGMNVPCKACGQMNAVPFAPGMSGGQRVAASGTSTIIIVILVLFLIVAVGCGGVLVALLLPAVQSARQAARRMSSSNNMKQIMLAMHNYHDTYNTFPPAYQTDKDGNPTVSWRVLILPFMEEAPLFDQFDVSKPWDSPENLALAEHIPPAYRSPLVNTTPANRLETSYVLITGPGTAFREPGKGAKISEITDGTSNTICMVESANTGVVWTQPTDLDVAQLDMIIHDLKDAKPGQLSSADQVMNAGFFDGSVRGISKNVPPAELKKAFESSDGQSPRLD